MKNGMLRLLVSHWLIIPEFLLLIFLSMIIVPFAVLALFFSIVAGAKFAVLALLGCGAWYHSGLTARVSKMQLIRHTGRRLGCGLVFW